jgi:hypothetical protein
MRDNQGRAIASIAVCVLRLLFAFAFLSPPRVDLLAFPRMNAHSFRPGRSDELGLTLMLLPPRAFEAPAA